MTSSEEQWSGSHFPPPAGPPSGQPPQFPPPAGPPTTPGAPPALGSSGGQEPNTFTDATSPLPSGQWQQPPSDWAQVSSSGSAKSPPLGRIALVVVSVVALLGVGFALFQVTRSDSGFATPEEAADNLIESLNNNDPMGLVETILPSERESIVEPSMQVMAELVRLEILSDDVMGEGRPTMGNSMKMEVTEPITYKVEELFTGPNKVSLVTFTGGSIEMTTDAAEAEKLLGESGVIPEPPTGSLGAQTTTIQFTSEGMVTSQDGTPEPPQDFRLAMVDQGDGYFVSGLYTIADQMRRGAGLPVPTTRLGAQGAESPEAAAEQFITSLLELDFETAMGTLDPIELATLYDYWGAYGADMAGAADEARAALDEAGVSYEVTSIEFATSEVNGRTHAAIRGLSASFSMQSDIASGTALLEISDERVLIDVDFLVDGTPVVVKGEFDLATETLTIDADVFGTTVQGSMTMADGRMTGEIQVDQDAIDFNVDLATLEGTANVVSGGESFEIRTRVESGCLIAEFDGAPETLACGAELESIQAQLSANAGQDLSELETPGLAVVEREVDGEKGWYVSGFPTIADGVAKYLENFEPGDIEELTNFGTF